jgi:hypothetical protein
MEDIETMLSLQRENRLMYDRLGVLKTERDLARRRVAELEEKLKELTDSTHPQQTRSK